MKESYRNLIQAGLLMTRVLQEGHLPGKELRLLNHFLRTSNQEKGKKDKYSMTKSSGVKIMTVFIFLYSFGLYLHTFVNYSFLFPIFNLTSSNTL